MIKVSTHVLDTSLGKPAAGISVRLRHEGITHLLGVTDADGRVAAPPLEDDGECHLEFAVGEYFRNGARESLFEEIVIQFRITSASKNYHVPLLLSPFGYSVYRGS